AHGVCLLGRFNGVLNLQLASFVFTVGEKNHCFPSDLLGEFVVRSEINRVVQLGAARSAESRYRASTQTGNPASSTAAAVHVSGVHGILQRPSSSGTTRHQTPVEIK